MIVNFLTSPGTWFHPHVEELVQTCRERGHTSVCFTDHRELDRGDMLFVLSYYRILPAALIGNHTNNVVIHASDLPRGRGNSPIAWQILEGKNEIPFSLFELTAGVDEGPVYVKDTLRLCGTELYDEWRQLAGTFICRMALDFLAAFPSVTATPQSGEASNYRKRTAADDQLDPTQPLALLFDHLRICDPKQFPAWFEIRGRKFKLRIEPL